MPSSLLDESHDPALQSWVDSANAGDGFGIQNLPYASVRRAGSRDGFRIGVAIGDQVLDLARCEGLDQREIFGAATLNDFMALGPERWHAVRMQLSRALRKGAREASTWRAHLVPRASVEFTVPASIGDYTDFYTSVHHATNIGRLFRPDNPLLPNYKWVPIGYHGRSSTITVSGIDFRRPHGQTLPPNADKPLMGPSKRLDFELEMGIYIGAGNAQGAPIPIAQAERHIFGICLLNDWSARDIQAWEYQPLGPFLSKNFASTISPWIVTLEALAPFRAAFDRTAGDPPPLPYLDSAANREHGALDVQLEVAIETKKMRDARSGPQRIGHTSYRHAYWTAAQLVTHHTVNGCALRPGDLLGTGTLSGPGEGEMGSLAELTQGGKQPVTLPNGEQRTFLEDGDRVILSGRCEKPGAAPVSLGEASATVLPAL